MALSFALRWGHDSDIRYTAEIAARRELGLLGGLRIPPQSPRTDLRSASSAVISRGGARTAGDQSIPAKLRDALCFTRHMAAALGALQVTAC